MKHKAKTHKTKGSKTRKHGKKRHSKRGLAGLGVVKAAGAVAKDAMNPLGILLGYTGGAFVGRMLDKIEAIRPDETKTGFQAKALIKPLALIAVGTTISVIAGKKAGTGAAFVKNVGFGVTVSGGVALVKGVIKKDLFTGLGASAPVDAKYLTETKDLLKKLIEDNSKDLNLPAPTGDMSGLNGNGVYTQTLQIDNMDTVL